MNFFSLSLLLAIVLLVAAATGGTSSSQAQQHLTQEQAFSANGRIYWRNDTRFRKGFPVGNFDWSGTSFCIFVPSSQTGFYPLRSISIQLAVANNASNRTLNQPSVFSAFLFNLPAGTKTVERIPPANPWKTADRYFNFSSANFSANLTKQTELFTASNANNSVLVWVVKETEANWNRRFSRPNFFSFVSFIVDVNLTASSTAAAVSARREVLLDEQKQWQQQQQQQQTPSILGVLPPTPSSRISSNRGDDMKPPRRLLFIGDSITAGYCNIKPADIPDNQTTYKDQRFTAGWPWIVAIDNLRAQLHTVAWSGMGLVSNCPGADDRKNNNLTMSHNVLYRTCGTEPSWPWNYATNGADAHSQEFLVDAVVVNLGTNDWSTTNTSNSTVLSENTTKRLLQTYKGTYVSTVERLAVQLDRTRRLAGLGPLPLFMACGPMIVKDWCWILKEVFEEVKTRLHEKLVRPTFVEFPELPDNKTSCGHPNAPSGGDEILAKHLLQVFKNASLFV